MRYRRENSPSVVEQRRYITLRDTRHKRAKCIYYPEVTSESGPAQCCPHPHHGIIERRPWTPRTCSLTTQTLCSPNENSSPMPVLLHLYYIIYLYVSKASNICIL